MSGGVSIGFVDFSAFSFEFERVRCVSFRPFLVRNWCGSAVGGSEDERSLLAPEGLPRLRRSRAIRAWGGATQNGPKWDVIMSGIVDSGR
jgi:hypothetical protein